MGIKFTYKVPNFPVLTVDLRKVKLQLPLKDKSVVLLDGFIRADGSLEGKRLPYIIIMLEWCFVPIRLHLLSKLRLVVTQNSH